MMRCLRPLSLGLLILCPAFSFAQDKKPPEVDPQQRLTGMYRGWYHYPDDSQRPVNIQVVLIQDGANVVGIIKEANHFGGRLEPWLQSFIKGKFEDGKLSVKKQYDGTAGVEHDVDYNGDVSKDGNKIDGMWNIGDFSGRFELERAANTRPGPHAGLYAGTYHYPKELDKKPVEFTMLLYHHDMRLAGFTREANTFGKRKDEPWLHAGFRGKLDDKGVMTFIKTYDGTAGEDGDVEYTGQPSRDRNTVEGTWTIPDVYSGRFTLQKLRLDAKTLESLK